MPATPPTTPKPRRRWLQFSLRTLFVLMLVLGCGFGWLAHKIERAREQRQAERAIREVGGGVRRSPASEGILRTWAGKLVGEDLMSGDVIWVSFRGHSWGHRVTDAWLEHLKGLSQLETLDLTGTQVTGTGLEHLRGLTRLRTLWLSDTQVTDAGLEHLTGLTQLQKLFLSGPQVTGTGLEHLKELPRLQMLHLGGTRLTDAGLQHVKGLSQLQMLYLGDTQVTDAGVAGLKRALPNVTIER